MFKNLKTKLTLLNLAVAGLILLAMSVIAFALISNTIKQNSEQVLQVVTNNLALQQSDDAAFNPAFVLKSTGGIFPYIIVGVDGTGRMMTSFAAGKSGIAENQFMLSKDQIDRIIQIVQDQNAKLKAIQQQVEAGQQTQDPATMKKMTMQIPNGIINLGGNKYYRYRVIYTANPVTGSMMYAVLQDLSSERALLTNVAIALGTCVLGGLLLMTLGGLFLAERSIRPIRVAWQKQRDFVADASHELRTPLAAIIGNIDVVMDDPAAKVEERQLYCQGIAEEAGRMSQLVDGLLMLARADSDTLVFEKKPVDVARLMNSVVTLMQPVAAKKSIPLHLNTMDFPVIHGDGDRLKQVMIQLLDNAVKYTPHDGSVNITVDTVRNMARIQVEDTGIGIAPEHQKKIFERFYRVDPSREHEVGGHGLGLAIVKYIVEYHGGAVSVVSEKAKGSTFIVLLPVSATPIDLHR